MLYEIQVYQKCRYETHDIDLVQATDIMSLRMSGGNEDEHFSLHRAHCESNALWL